MRTICLLMLLGLAACANQNASAPAPCNPPMFIDATGNCVSQPVIQHRR
jgi:hypothetical protein